MLFGHQDNSNQPSVAAPADVPAPAPEGVNPLAVDPATGTSLPVVPAGSPGPVDTPDEPSVLDQGPGLAPSPEVAPAPNPVVSAAMPDPSTPFSPDPVPAPDPTPPEIVTPDAPAPSPVDSFDNSTAGLAAPTPTFGSDQSDDSDDSVITAGDPMLENPVAAVADTSMPDMSVPSQDDSASSMMTSPMSDESPAGTDDLFSLKQQVVTQLSPLVAHLEQSPDEKFKTTMMLIQSTDNSSLLQDAYNLAQQIPDEKSRAQALLDVVNEINYFTQQSSNQ